MSSISFRAQHSRLPSGHMVIATAFAAVMITLQPRWWPVLTILLCIGAAALIGGWHFIGHVIAGAFVGLSVGWLAAELLLEHAQHHLS
jgi:membrane-associated phospholipid phosphatase